MMLTAYAHIQCNCIDFPNGILLPIINAWWLVGSRPVTELLVYFYSFPINKVVNTFFLIKTDYHVKHPW